MRTRVFPCLMMLIKEGKSNKITGIHKCFFVEQSLSAEPCNFFNGVIFAVILKAIVFSVNGVDKDWVYKGCF